MADAISIEQMKALLGEKQKVSNAPIATLTKGKDGQIDVTEEVIEKLYQPVLDKVIKHSEPALAKTIADGLNEKGDELGKQVKDFTSKAQKQITSEQEKLDQSFADYSAQMLSMSTQVRPIEIRTERDSITLTGVQHSKFELLLRIVGANLPVFMVGPAGTGKTKGAEDVAAALGIDFYAMSVGSQTSKADIFGYKDANGIFHETAFYKAYKNGGVFLLDEADAGNANVLVGLNAALSNGYVFFPNGTMTKMNDDFRMIATANTFGNGASRQYVGRNQLDAATLDRFTVITWDIDDRIEEAIASLSPTFGTRWLKVVREVRKEAIDKLELRAVVSPRATLRGSVLLESGVAFEDAVQVALIANMPEAEREVLLNLANATWAKSETKKKGRPVGSTNKPKVDLDELVSVFDAAEVDEGF